MPKSKPDPGASTGADTGEKRQRYAMLPIPEESKELIRWTAEHCAETQAGVIGKIASSPELAVLISEICESLALDYDRERAEERTAKFTKTSTAAEPDNGGALDPSGKE